MIRFFANSPKFKFIEYRHFAFSFSAFLSFLSVLCLIIKGLSFGIDFLGGSLIEIGSKSNNEIEIASIRSQVKSLHAGDVEVQKFGSNIVAVIRLGYLDNSGVLDISHITSKLSEQYEIRRVEIVGPRISKELIYSGILGIVLSLFTVLIYLWCRFEWQLALGAIIATIHDLILTLGFFSLFSLEFNTTSIAAILTIVVYSLNDTVVIYDRVREIKQTINAYNLFSLFPDQDFFSSLIF